MLTVTGEEEYHVKSVRAERLRLSMTLHTSRFGKIIRPFLNAWTSYSTAVCQQRRQEDYHLPLT